MDPDDLLVRFWSDSFTEEVLSFGRPWSVSNEEVFADVHHSLLHSSHGEITEPLLQMEHSNAEIVEEKCRQMDKEMEELDTRQHQEMEKAVERDDEKLVNRLAGQHMEERQMTKMRWESELENVRQTQLREFREWVMCVHEEIKTNEEKASIGQYKVPRSESSFSIEAASMAPVLQESFTITLGAQMKQMHNLRLVAADALDLCRYPTSAEDALPQRLQTSMSLYSNNLCGLVLLTDDRLSAYSGVAKDFADLCRRSTEFHFQTFDQQIESVKEDFLEKALKWREEYQKKKRDEEESLGLTETENTYESNRKSLKNGDFYVTKHSNLCEVHVIFHMVCDDSVMSGNINSRHSVVMGLRNVLKAASLSDVTTLTLPLLLAHEMSEEMTVAWCMKRAELVFKCVKGFMMEVSSWGGSEIKTLQFLVPKDIDHDVFNRLTAMLAGIFRTSNPIRGK